MLKILKIIGTMSGTSSGIDLIGFHGHAVFHNSSKELTWQIGNANLLSELTGISVVSDFRRRDIAAGRGGERH